MKGFWKTYAVLAVAAGLVAWAVLVESKREPQTEDGKTKAKVFAVDKAKVSKLELTPAEGEGARLAREGTSWKLEAPLQAPADANEVDAILRSVETLEVDDTVSEAPAKLADYGLEKPKTMVAVWSEGQAEAQKLLIGDKTPDGSALYAKKGNEAKVFTIASYAGTSFEKKPFDLRDRDVLHVKRDAVKSLAVAGPEGPFTLARTASGEWAFIQPLQTRAGRWSVDGLLGALEGLRMESIAGETPSAAELKTWGLEPPVRTVTLEVEGGTRTLQLGATAGEKKYYARETGSPRVVVVPGAVVDDLAKGMGELRAKRILDVATYDVEGFDAETDVKRVYAKSAPAKEGDAGTWKRTAPDAKELDTNKVQDALFAIGGSEVLEFVDKPAGLEAYGLDKPALKVTLRFSGGKPAQWFELGQKDGAWHARREGDTALLKLDPRKAEELLKAFKEL